MSKLHQIRQWLQSGKSLTPKQAIEMFNCYRLAAVIFVLRERGMKIKTEPLPTRDGGTFAKYTLEEA